MKQNKQRRHDTNQIIQTKFYPTNLPDIWSRDRLAEASDDDLSDRFEALQDDKGYVERSTPDLSVVPWEVEIAYTQREAGVRVQRRLAHERFMTGRMSQ